MALMPCPECGGKVSTGAISCPHCGAKVGLTPMEAGLMAFALEQQKLEQRKGCADQASGCGCLLVLLVIACILYAIFGPKKNDGPIQAPIPPAQKGAAIP